MSQNNDQKIKFLKNNRAALRQSETTGLIVITGNSLIQASADKAYPFVQDSNFFYLTGLEEPGLGLVIDGEDEYLIAPLRSKIREFFEGELDHKELSRTSGISKIYENEAGWQRLNKSLQSEKKVAILEPADSYIEQADMFTNPSRRRLKERLQEQNPKLDFSDLRAALAGRRMVKSPYEIEMIKKAIGDTIKLFGELGKARRDAQSEADLMAAAVAFVAKNQNKFAFDPIIAGGGNAVTLHYEKNNSKLQAGQLLLLDIGLKHAGYAADLTRTVSLSQPTDRQQAVYDAVLAVQKYAVSLLKPGLSLKGYEENVMNFMGERLVGLKLIDSPEKEKIRRFFPHSVSHSLGIDTHDVGDYERPLEEGMVLTVEPGIYIKEESLGVRIEDDVLITKDGARVLSSKLPRNVASLTITS